MQAILSLVEQCDGPREQYTTEQKIVGSVTASFQYSI
jgi:hypothetical protein